MICCGSPPFHNAGYSRQPDFIGLLIPYNVKAKVHAQVSRSNGEQALDNQNLIRLLVFIDAL